MVEHAHAPKRDVHPIFIVRGGIASLRSHPHHQQACTILRRTAALKKLNNNLFLIIVNRCYDENRKDDTNLPLSRDPSGQNIL
jgi:hypothetical protein